MPNPLHLSKVSIRRVMGEIDYASDDALIESLRGMKAILNVPISRYIKDLLDGVVDSISFTKDKPYCYLFARRFEKSLSITIKEEEKVIEFSIPLHEVEKLLTV